LLELIGREIVEAVVIAGQARVDRQIAVLTDVITAIAGPQIPFRTGEFAFAPPRNWKSVSAVLLSG